MSGSRHQDSRRASPPRTSTQDQTPSPAMVSLLCNPLATAEQLASSPSQADGVPVDLETSLRWAGCALIQSAGILLQL